MKYDIKICKCGRIHAIPNDTIQKALEKDKGVLLICARCGSANVIAADKEIAPNGKECYMMRYSSFSPYDSITFGQEVFGQEKLDTILYDHGYGVPMETGNYASAYDCRIFRDDSLYNLEPLLFEKNITKKIVSDFIADHNKKACTVDMNRMINEIPDDVLSDLSKFWIDGFKWKGTKYETIYNTI